MRTSLKIGFVIAFVSISWNVMAQKDFGAWVGVDLRVPVLKKLDVGLEVQSRFESNITQVERSFISPYLKYKLHKFVGVGLDYRLSNIPSEGSFFGNTYTHRTTLDLEFKDLLELFLDKTPLEVTVRVRGTHEVRGGDLNNNYFRSRIKLAYNLPGTKLEPHILGEVFYHFNDQISYSFSSVETRHRINKYRLRVGLSYPLTKQHTVKLFYIVEPRTESPRTDFILGAGYTFKLKQLFD